MTLSTRFSIFILAFFFCACEKKDLPKQQEIQPIPEKIQPVPTAEKLNMDLIAGHWKLISKPQNYYSLYFGVDYFFKQDNTNIYAVDLDGTWQIANENTILVKGRAVPSAEFVVLKLNADSLVMKIGNVIFRHSRLPIVQSQYALSTFSGYLETPIAITADKDNNIFVLEYRGERIKMISASDQKISVVAGNNPMSMLEPIIGFFADMNNITLDKNDDIIVAGEYGRLKRISIPNKIISNILVDYSGGTVDQTMRYRTNSVRIDDEGNIYEAEGFHPKVRKIDAGTGKIKDIIGMKYAQGLKFNPNPGTGLNVYIIPNAIALDKSGNLFVADGFFHCIWKYNLSTGSIQLIAGTGVAGFSGDGQVATSAMFNKPGGIAVDLAGNLFISDTGNNRIRKISIADNKVSTIAGNGFKGHNGEWDNALMGKLNSPTNILVDPAGNIVFLDALNYSVRKLTLKR